MGQSIYYGLLLTALALPPQFAFAADLNTIEAISREVTVFNTGQPAEQIEAISRELTVFNTGQPAEQIEAISREFSVQNIGELTNPAPMILLHPENQVAPVGRRAVFIVNAVGAFPLSFQWWREDQPLPGATNASLAFPSILGSDAGRYSVVVTNPWGMVTSTVATLVVPTLHLAVEGNGTVSFSPARPDLYPGESVTLNATPGRYHTFLRWTDGVTTSNRVITMGASNNYYTAVFTNAMALESLPLKVWEASFGGDETDTLTALTRTADGGYLLAGHSDSFPNGSGTRTAPNCGSQNFWIVKLDGAGREQWQRAFGSFFQYVQLAAVHQTSEGGFLLAGTTHSGQRDIAGDCGQEATNHGGADFWIVRLDIHGHRLWDRSFGGTADDTLTCLAPTPDGGFLLGGRSSSPPDGNKTSPMRGTVDYWVVRIDAAGNRLWDRSYGGVGANNLNAMAATADGGVVLAGSSDAPPGGNKTSSNHGGRDFWVIRLDATGNKLWETSHGTTNAEQARAVLAMADGGFAVAGDWLNREIDYWVLRLNSSGGLVWSNSLGALGDSLDEETAFALAAAPDGGVVVTGRSSTEPGGNKTSPNFGSADFWTVRLDAHGNKLWDRSDGSAGTDEASSMVPAWDGGYLVGGNAYAATNGNKTTTTGTGNVGDYWVVSLFDRQAPVGTPVVLVNGLYSPSNSFFIPATNTASVTFTSTFPGGFIFYTTDGAEPDFNSTPYDGAPVVLTQSAIVRAIAYTSDGQQFQAADPVLVQRVPLYSFTDTTPGGGRWTVDPPAGPYLSNTVVTLTAIASNGWTFLRWAGDATGTGTNLALVMNSSKTVRAVFGTSVGTNVFAGGTVAFAPPDGPYAYGSVVRLSAVPAAGKYFSRWFNFISGPMNNPLDFTVTAPNTNVTAFFGNLTANNFSLTTLLNGSGTVTRSPAPAFYASGALVTLTAVPDAGHVFVGWGGDTNSALNPLEMVMNTNKTVTARFTLAPTVALTAPSAGQQFVRPADVFLNATASDGDGTVARVEFYANAMLLGAATNPPYGCFWSNALPGLHFLSARAVDNLGATGTSAPISIVVTTLPPVVTSFSPRTGRVDDVVTIFGTNFHPLPSSNLVFFGATRAPVVTASTSVLTARVPAGATYGPISVTKLGLTGQSQGHFVPTFPASMAFGSNSLEEPFSFALPSHGAGSVLLKDLDGDGRTDIVSASYDAAFGAVFWNESQPGALGPASFSGPVNLPAFTQFSAVGDLNGDGRPELVYAADTNILVRENQGVGGRVDLQLFPTVAAIPAGLSPVSVAVADLDGDGREDLVALSPFEMAFAHLRNRHTGGPLGPQSFDEPTIMPTPGMAIFLAVGEVDGDGRPDIVTAARFGGFEVHRNTSQLGAISFAAPIRFDVTNGVNALNLVDLDGDGRLDVITVDARLSVHRNTAVSGAIDPGSFAARVDVLGVDGYRPGIGDLSGDGRPDLVIPSDSGNLWVVLNHSDPGAISPASFSQPIPFAVGLSPYFSAVGDLDGDGAPDIVTGRYQNSLVIHRNTLKALNTPPIVALTNPVAGAPFNTPASIALAASASDSEGTVTQVCFYAGTNLLGCDASPPFQFIWMNPPPGSHSLTAVATDNSGLSSTSAPVSITVTNVNQPPLVSIISPAQGASLVTGSDVPLTASAADVEGGSVTLVEFFANGSLLGSDAQSPFSITWSNVPPGTHSLTARATDNGGLMTTSAPVVVSVSLFSGPPAFRFEQAAYEVTEDGGTVTLRVLRNFSGFATVNFATGDGSAASGADYNAAAGQLQFQAGDTFKTIVVNLLEDLVVEGPHTFHVSLSLPSGGGLTNPTVATVTIVDNDVQTGSSFLSIVPPAPVIIGDLGSLRVYLTGDGGLGQWRLPWDRTWRAGGTAATGLQPGEYEIEFRPISGYLTPPPTTLAVGRAQETRSTNAYTFLVSTPTGSLTVFLDPPVVAGNADVSCRGQWKVNDGAYQDSGATVAGLPAGVHTVTFKPLGGQCGWGTPAARQATVLPGVSNSFRVSYFTNAAGPSTPVALNFANDIQTSYQNQQPFTFVGQITTEFGDASGVVVKERVVLTAAHVVFDDYSLAWVGQGRWLFQRHNPDYQPAPQEVRGYYVNGGYAAQRQAEGTPGVSASASFDLDVAALYFYEAAGRGGYGGYLVSETPSPQWLQTNALKALVGYPVEGIPAENVGRMHTVGPTSMSFNQSSGTVFTCTQIRGFPGNSGGPLCVRLSANNYFFPAGIYVGGSDRAIVRAIDSRAVELINAAELTSNLGTNQTGGGVIRLGVTVPAGLCAHYATVTLEPPAAVAAGAQWRVHYKPSADSSGSLSPWTNSSTYRIILNNKPDFLELRDAEGFFTPTTADLVLACQQTNLVFTYVQHLPRLDVLEGRHLVLQGVTNRQYQVEYNGRLGTPVGWTPWTIVQFTAGNNITILSNALAPTGSNRFYRAVRLP